MSRVQAVSAKVATWGRVPSTGSAARAPRSSAAATARVPAPRSRARSAQAHRPLQATAAVTTATRRRPPAEARSAKTTSESHSCGVQGAPWAV